MVLGKFSKIECLTQFSSELGKFRKVAFMRLIFVFDTYIQDSIGL